MAKSPSPTFTEPERLPGIDDGETDLEFDPDPDAVAEVQMRSGYAPFRPDWERMREPDGADCG